MTAMSVSAKSVGLFMHRTGLNPGIEVCITAVTMMLQWKKPISSAMLNNCVWCAIMFSYSFVLKDILKW